MIGLFSDIFARKDTAYSRIDVRIKLLVVISTIVAVIVSNSVLFPLCVFTTAAITIRLAGVPFRYFAMRLIPAGTLVAVLVVLRTFTEPGDVLFSLTVGPFIPRATYQGLLSGLLLGTRVLGAVSTMLFLGATTPVYRLFGALRQFGVPSDWVEVALLMYRYVFLLADTTADITTAQKVRLGYSGFGRSVRSLGILTGAVLTGAIDQAVRTNDGMRTRGYSGRFPVPPVPTIKRRGILGAVAANVVLWSVWSVFQFAVAPMPDAGERDAHTNEDAVEMISLDRNDPHGRRE